MPRKKSQHDRGYCNYCGEFGDLPFWQDSYTADGHWWYRIKFCSEECIQKWIENRMKNNLHRGGSKCR